MASIRLTMFGAAIPKFFLRFVGYAVLDRCQGSLSRIRTGALL
jgi:hypothetical protein